MALLGEMCHWRVRFKSLRICTLRVCPLCFLLAVGECKLSAFPAAMLPHCDGDGFIPLEP